MKLIRRRGSWTAAGVAAATLGLGACGGTAEEARSPSEAKPAKITRMAWGSSDTDATPDDSPAAAEDEAEAEPAAGEDDAIEAGAIDLDALSAKPEPRAKSEPAPAPEPEPTPEPEAAEEEEVAEAESAPPPVSAASDPLALELQKRRAQAKARAEKQKAKNKRAKSGKSKKAAAKKKAAPADAAPAATYRGSDPCRAASFSVSAVRDACASGGRPAAKRVMKEAIGKATATGQLLKCSSCHADQRDYGLKGGAVADLQRWLNL